MSQTEQVVPALEHEIRVGVSPEQVLAAITTDDGLSAWYGAGMTASETEGVVFDVAPHPRFRWSIQRKGDDTVVWTCVEGPGQSVGTEAVYECVIGDDARTTVRLTHRGWSEDDAAFRRCNTYWGALMLQLQHYVETGERRPVFS